MSRRIIYRKQLLQAVQALLEGTPSSRAQAQHIVQRCYTTIKEEIGEFTLNEIIWYHFIMALTDSVYYENEEFLQETREILLGYSSQSIARTIFMDDYRAHFTPNEAQWYEQLLSMLDFIATIPFASIHQATVHAWQNKSTWGTTRRTIPEAIQAEEIEEEYQRRKALITTIAADSPSPKDIGDEKVYHLVLQEVTALITGLGVGKAAVYYGYPILDSPYTRYGKAIALASGVDKYALDMSDDIIWARRILEALTGKGGFFILWRLNKAPTFGTDILLISLH